MTKVEERIVIGAPAARVFGRLGDPERLSEWMLNLREVKRTSRVRTGTGVKIALVATAAGKRAAGTGRYTVWDPPARLEFQTDLDTGVTSKTTFDLAPDDKGTRLTVTVQYELPPGKGPGRFAAGLLGSSLVGRELRRSLGNLKQQLEAEAPHLEAANGR
jgi:uncharacterized protein YndB with AHSA1/START domain